MENIDKLWVLYNYDGTADDNALRYAENKDIELFLIYKLSPNSNCPNAISLTLDQAQDVANKLNMMLQDVYEAQSKLL